MAHVRTYDWQPLNMTRAEVAATVFRRSESWLIDHTPVDFPKPVDGLYAREAVVEWNRLRHGLALPQDGSKAATARILARLSDGKGAGAIPR